jgi:hypothetical protein
MNTLSTHLVLGGAPRDLQFQQTLWIQTGRVYQTRSSLALHDINFQAKQTRNQTLERSEA